MNRIACIEHAWWQVAVRGRLIGILACVVSLVLPASASAQSFQPATINIQGAAATVAAASMTTVK